MNEKKTTPKFAQISFLTSRQVNTILEPIDEKYIEEFEGLSYVSNSVVTNILNQVFNHAWSWEIIDQGIQTAIWFDKRQNKEMSGEYCWVKGRLSMLMFVNNDPNNMVTVVKEAIGGKALIGNTKLQSQGFKSASSDALKKAASLLGVARNVYMKAATYRNIAYDEKTKDSWNDKTLNEFSKEISYVQKLKSKLGEKQFQNYINEYCIETENYSTYGMVTPCNIIPFLSYMDDLGLIDDVKNPIDVVEDSLRSVS